MRAVITGGAGFIGSHLLQSCLEGGDDVIAFDDLSEGRKEHCEGARLVVGNVTDAGALKDVFAGADVVYHLAALRSVARSVEDPIGTDRINGGGTLQVLDAARHCGVRRVVITSSSSVYGGVAPVPTDEFAPLEPRSPYAVSKVTGEHYARVYARMYDMETVILRPFNIFGPRQQPDSAYSGVISIFIDALLAERSPTIHGDGSQSRDFTFVGDAVTAFRRAATEPYDRLTSKTYNVGAGGETTLMELWDLLREIEGAGPDPTFGPPRPGDVGRSRADISRARAELGYEPSTGLPEGLRRTIDWLRGGG